MDTSLQCTALYTLTLLVSPTFPNREYKPGNGVSLKRSVYVNQFDSPLLLGCGLTV